MSWLYVALGIGLIAPMIVVTAVVIWHSSGVPGSGAIIRSTVIGLIAGAVGGVLVSVVVIGLALALRAML